MTVPASVPTARTATPTAAPAPRRGDDPRQRPPRRHLRRRRRHRARRGRGRRGRRRPSSPAPPKLTDLTIPLATLLGPPTQPGESHGFGPLDPALCRALAALAAASPHTTACVTVTDDNGYAIGHGCLRSGRRKAPLPGAPDPPLTALPARLNLTVTATRLTKLLQPAPARPSRRAARPRVDVRLGPHRRKRRPRAPPGQRPGPRPARRPALVRPLDDHLAQRPALPRPPRARPHPRLRPPPESHAYEPNDTLRHLVQIRDAECTLPTCSRHAKDSDFEHAVPYDQGGRTCACNAGARSRACHQVKQSPGWKVTQPKPGWHQWQTPSGRTYTQEPKRYPT